HAPRRARALGVRSRRDCVPTGAARTDGCGVPRTRRGRTAARFARGTDRGGQVARVPAFCAAGGGDGGSRSAMASGRGRTDESDRHEGGAVIAADDVQAVLTVASDPEWFAMALQRIDADPKAISELFPAAGRRCGREVRPELSGWRTDDAARALMLRTVTLRSGPLATVVEDLYRFGDAHEKRAGLFCLPT